MRCISGIIIVAVAVLPGCNKPNESAGGLGQLADANVPYDPSVIDLDAGASTDWEQPAQPIAEQPVAYREPAVDTAMYSPAGRMHTVQRKDTLYSLARLYYNDHRQWKKIYEANRDQIANPNIIKVGMKLVIP